MYDPDVFRQLHSVHDAEGITFERQCNLEYARAESVHGLCDIDFSAFRCDRQGGKADGPRPFGEFLRIR